MSLRIDTSEWLSGALVIGETGLGILAENIPATGDHGPGYAFNSLSLPADNGKEICGTITTWPTAGTLFAYEDTSYEFSGAPDGSYWFEWQLKVDGAAVGSPVRVWLQVGPASAQVSAVTDAAVASFEASVSGAAASAQINATTDDADASFASSVQGSPVSAQFAATTDGSIFSGSAKSSPLCSISATTQDAVFYGGSSSAALAQWPLASDVRFGITYGPTGTEYVGTMTEGGSYPSAESIAAASAAATVAALQAIFLKVDAAKMNGADIIGDGSETDPWRGVGVQP